MNFHGKAERLKDQDLPYYGAKIGVGEDEIHAVLDVECRGDGFDSQGRPAMLFEPHVFYRELARTPEKQRAAVKAGLAYRGWRRGNYPRDSYPRLSAAIKIDATAALRSCSWGLGQVMGFNHELAGYGTAESMVKAFTISEGFQLGGMVAFIKAAGLDDELRSHDWHGFARGYNGAGYARHGYHTKLKRAFEKWQKIPDTPFLMSKQRTKTPVKNTAVNWLGAFINAIKGAFR